MTARPWSRKPQLPSAATATDGAGGERSVPTQMRKVGASAVVASVSDISAEELARSPSQTEIVISNIAVAASGVRGAQTVPRAELEGAALLFREA